ncbi:group II intron reverse transcriptase/maturase [Candidatus Epulonipiscium fishelsonii]|uniref:Group II intron reverse transcriptase/maturase n=1 Tax=Candidatus Epulonipiscium fishelsonii TaxID=77094 RepID=A0ACC8XC40_9FIRM|nr:group II intron reverse transcriptase/maturase [Epulopiscium sp. SCG-D08WGA-EpuloA1]
MNTSNKESALPNITDWQQINWLGVEKYVKKLQQRIYHAESLGNNRKVRDLQRMLMNSNAALLVSIKRVTQINGGKRTSGVDDYKVLTPSEILELYKNMKSLNLQNHNPKPAYRTYIKNKNGKLIPLGIPIIKDRVYQNIVKLALEPQWECRFEPTSYGFRPNRGCHDAIERIFNTIRGSRQWVFEGNFKGCFDNLNHDFIMKQLGDFPEREIIGKWLKTGFLNNEVFIIAPQGGIISPLLANIALHGMEETLSIQYKAINKNGIISYENRSTYAMARYADDFVVMCNTEQEAHRVYDLLKPYLEIRGFELPANKTKITPITSGFDFLGFNIKKYKAEQGNKLLIKPSKESISKFKQKISSNIKNLYGNNTKTLIDTLNPIIIGTANYWSPSVAREIYSEMDTYIWIGIKKFLVRSHPKKSWKWIKEQYFKADKTGQSKNRWILTDPITGNQLKKMAWTPIVRHEQIKHTHSLFNKELEEYFIKRSVKEFKKNNVAYRQKLAKK